jgi:hypothetical protein
MPEDRDTRRMALANLAKLQAFSGLSHKLASTVNNNVLTSYRDALTQCRTFYASALKVGGVASLPDSVYDSTYATSELPLPIGIRFAFKRKKEAPSIEALCVTKDKSGTLPQ